jgi:Tat protein translocase TatB subunit
MLNIGPPELLLIFVIALVIVGPQRLPELGRTIGKGLREFRKMQDEVKDLVNTGMGDDLKQATAELRRTASDLKSATDVRSAFRNDTPRTRPHGVTRDAPPPTRLPDDTAPVIPPTGTDAAAGDVAGGDDTGPGETGSNT